MRKVVVFVDYENIYRGARRACFKETDSPTLGHIDPLKPGQSIATDHRRAGFLYQVRIYRRPPVPEKDAVGHAAAERRAQAWNAVTFKVARISRPLRYPGGRSKQRPEEKGVAVGGHHRLNRQLPRSGA